MPRPGDGPRAAVVGGRRAAPPDDCGGIYGHYRLLEILGDPAHPEHAEMADWLGLDPRRAAEFDPAHVDLDELDAAVRARLR